ncbi:MAG TPA: threonine synthase [Burkholderiales bacterium]|jgi:threonine synthase|nr:threonine synthase [Burkholderiales bacterium]
MLYVSTRGAAPKARFSDILLEGLASDGGLYVPESFPKADLSGWRKLSYPELSFEILKRFMDDVADLRAIVDRTYTEKAFGSRDITPLRTLEPGLHLLGLSNGPTLAFKDIALQLVGHLFEEVLKQRKERLNVLGATSGDTGSAAEYALRGKANVNVFMLSPHGRMSAFQSAQMYALQDPNIHNLAVKGVFDDCQAMVKEVNADAAFKQRWRIGAVNSINWARVAAQVVYYFYGFFRATKSDSESVSFAVPSGNFGNIYAGYVARCMGLPIRKLVLATNENDVLDEFFRTGRYRPRKDVSATSSPSMDISKASNFERYVFDLVGRDGGKVRNYFSGSEFSLAMPREGFVSGRSSHADRVATIRRVHEKYGVTIDPHTADGVKVGEAHREKGVPMICLETALPVKFAATIREALGRDPERPAAFEGLEQKPQRFELIDPDAEAVKRIIERAGQA